MIRIHSSFHKCLTMYFLRVMRGALNRFSLSGLKYKHFESLMEDLYTNQNKYLLLSTNNKEVDLEKIDGDYRITRFVRDPRDLIVSGYFYHKREAEPWFRKINPTPEYWAPINGNVPQKMPDHLSYGQYLQTLDIEEGLLAEMEFRKFHLESLRKWPKENNRIKLFKYEGIVGNELKVFNSIFSFLKLPLFNRAIGLILAHRFSAKNMKGKYKHIRDPKSGQWKKYFTAKVHTKFLDQYADLLELLDYDLD